MKSSKQVRIIWVKENQSTEIPGWVELQMDFNAPFEDGEIDGEKSILAIFRVSVDKQVDCQVQFQKYSVSQKNRLIYRDINLNEDSYLKFYDETKTKRNKVKIENVILGKTEGLVFEFGQNWQGYEKFKLFLKTVFSKRVDVFYQKLIDLNKRQKQQETSLNGTFYDLKKQLKSESEKFKEGIRAEVFEMEKEKDIEFFHIGF